jgi:uncharacterized protein (UPF0218 family)
MPQGNVVRTDVPFPAAAKGREYAFGDAATGSARRNRIEPTTAIADLKARRIGTRGATAPNRRYLTPPYRERVRSAISPPSTSSSRGNDLGGERPGARRSIATSPNAVRACPTTPS